MSVDLEYIKASDGTGEAVRATVTAARSIGATTLAVDSVVNLPTKFIATSGTLNLENGVLNPTGVTVFLGHVDGTALSFDEVAPGYTDTGNSVGQVILIKPTTEWANRIADFLAVSHRTNGTPKPRASATDSTATLTPNIDNYNIYDITAQAAGLTIANPTGTPVNGDVIIIRVKDNGTARAISYGTSYENISGLDSITTTVANKTSIIGCVWNAATSKWQIVSLSTGA